MPRPDFAGSFRISSVARRDYREILKRSAAKFGVEAASRYRSLLLQAIRDIGSDPMRLGSKERPETMVSGARTYHIALSRERVAGDEVKHARHFLVYRQLATGEIEIGRILHDSRDLARHLPKDYRG